MKKEKHHKQLNYADRIKIEALYRAKQTKNEIARILNVHVSTIYRELKRGMFKRLDSDTWLYFDEYSADVAEKDYKYKQTSKGAPLKIANDHNLANYIETMIIEQKQSPDAVIGRIRAQRLSFDTSICTRTLYRYIDAGLFLHLSNKHLLMRGERKRSYARVRPVRRKKIDCRSIEERPDIGRGFGHWEMDTVIGKRAEKPCLLVLTERRTRNEIIFKLNSKTQYEVKRAIDRLERYYGDRFPQVFKTITCDNGGEFLDASVLEQSCIGQGQRTTVYYCHPYSAYERGSNENQNKFIRRFIPKGRDISKYSAKQILEIQSFINDYPRKILEYKTSSELFQSCLNA